MSAAQKDAFIQVMVDYMGEKLIRCARLSEFVPEIESVQPYLGAMDALGIEADIARLNEIYRQIEVTGIEAEQKFLFVYDEPEAFNARRETTLKHYPEGISLGYPIGYWKKRCRQIDAAPSGSELKAIMDMMVDLEASRAGYRVIRIEDGEFDWEADGILLMDRLVSNAQKDDFTI